MCAFLSVKTTQAEEAVLLDMFTVFERGLYRKVVTAVNLLR
jgi:hypothetical protein